MRTLRAFAGLPSTALLSADEILEFHAGRLLLLLRVAGTAGRIDGLTKMAKLDFFVRYPSFFQRVAAYKGLEEVPVSGRQVESSMIRFHYGPWDKRYYHVLAYLEARALIEVSDEGSTHRLQLTEAGKALANRLRGLPEFEGLVEHMKVVKRLVGRLKGSTLKNLVYEVFKSEVAQRRFGEVIIDGES